MPVVTISSQFGAGAPDVGRRVADRLRLQYVDQAVLVDAARELGVSVKSVEAHDERTDSLRERMVHFLQRALERSAAGGNVDPLMGAGNLELMLSQGYEDMMDASAPAMLDDRTYLETITQVIRDVADNGNLVVIGRGGQMILRDRADTVHVQLVADEDVRVGRVMEWLGLEQEDATKRMRNFNRSRAAFHKKFWKVDVWDPRLYDLVVNTTRISYDAAADCVVRMADALAGESAAAEGGVTASS